MKIFGEKVAWAYAGAAQSFKVRPIISGTGKATDFKFGWHIHRVHPNRNPLKFWTTGSVGVSKGCPKQIRMEENANLSFSRHVCIGL